MGELVEPPPRINPPVGLPGDELDIAALAARRRALRLARKGPQLATSRGLADAPSEPSPGVQVEAAVPSAAASGLVHGTAPVHTRARNLHGVGDAERPLTSVGPATAAQPAAERSDNGAVAAAEADLPADSAADEALSELPKDAAESVIVAEEQRSSFKRQQAAAAAAAQQTLAAAKSAAVGAAPPANAGKTADDRITDGGKGAGAADVAPAEARAVPGPVRTKLGTDGWLQSRLAELEHKVDSLSQAAADASGPPFASLSLPYSAGLGSTPSAVPLVGGGHAATVTAEWDSGGTAMRTTAEGAEADGSSSTMTQPDGAASPAEDEGDLSATREADGAVAAARDSSALVAGSDAAAQPLGAVGDATDSAAGASSDFLRPVRRITGAVPAFLRRRWQQMQPGQGVPAAQQMATTSREASSTAAAPQQLAAQLGELCLSAAPNEALLPEAPKHVRAVLGPLRRVRPQTLTAYAQPPRSRSAAARLKSAAVQAVEPDPGPVRLQQFRLGPAQPDRPPRALTAPVITQRLAMEPAWGASAQPESPPKFSQQRYGRYVHV